MVQSVVLDEIHKFRKWKRLVKGVYDTEGVPPRIIVTGSARLDAYQFVGKEIKPRRVSGITIEPAAAFLSRLEV